MKYLLLILFISLPQISSAKNWNEIQEELINYNYLDTKALKGLKCIATSETISRMSRQIEQTKSKHFKIALLDENIRVGINSELEFFVDHPSLAVEGISDKAKGNPNLVKNVSAKISDSFRTITDMFHNGLEQIKVKTKSSFPEGTNNLSFKENSLTYSVQTEKENYEVKELYFSSTAYKGNIETISILLNSEGNAPTETSFKYSYQTLESGIIFPNKITYTFSDLSNNKKMQMVLDIGHCNL